MDHQSRLDISRRIRYNTQSYMGDIVITGKTWKEQEDDRQLRLIREACGIKKFAWWPVYLKDGRSIWLATFFEYQDIKWDFTFDYRSRNSVSRLLKRELPWNWSHSIRNGFRLMISDAQDACYPNWQKQHRELFARLDVNTQALIVQYLSEEPIP